MPINKRTIPGIKHVRSAKTASTVPVDDFDSIASDWSQIDLIDPTDTNLVMQSGIAEHKSDQVFEYLNTKHQVTFILDGNIVVQDTETGEVFKGTAGDLFIVELDSSELPQATKLIASIIPSIKTPIYLFITHPVNIIFDLKI